MRLWSLHPKYLDRQGLLAVWREGLLAQKVLKGATKGYKNHPQLIRFKSHAEPIIAISNYLFEIYKEADNRNYSFDLSKIQANNQILKDLIVVTSGQMDFEVSHLLIKLQKRSIDIYQKLSPLSLFDPHPLFWVVPGEIEDWEKT